MKAHHVLMLLFGIAGIALVYKFMQAHQGVVSGQADGLGYSKQSRAQRYSMSK